MGPGHRHDRRFHGASALVSPRRCGGCGDALPVAVPWPSAAPSPALRAWCIHCRDRWGPPPGDWALAADGCRGQAAAVYRGRVRRAILMAKRGAPEAAIELLLARLPADRWAAESVVTWVPAHPRRSLRVPDAGRAFAEAIADRAGLPAWQLLGRSPLSRRQAGRGDEHRRSNPERLGLRAVGRVPPVVVIVDDVRTTGTTLDRAAHVLAAAGAEQVVAYTVAAAPGHPPGTAQETKSAARWRWKG